MNKKLKNRCDRLKTMSISKLKTTCDMERCSDSDVQSYRNKFLRLLELDDMLESLENGHLISAHIYESGVMPYIVAFVGKIDDFKVFHEKYFAYDTTLVSMLTNSAEARSLISKGEFSLDSNVYNNGVNDYFFIKLHGGKRFQKNGIDVPEIKLYPFSYEEHTPEICNPWYSDWQQFITDASFETYSIDECMDNIDMFITESIDAEPLFGIDKLKKDLDIA